MPDAFLHALLSSAMVMLTERDENMAAYMAVTPVGKTGYVVSRLILPAIIAFFFSILLTYIFALTDWRLLMLSEVSLLMSLSSTAAALFIFSFSRNRVEGMAMAKMASLIFLGLFVPFFVLSDVQYLAAFLPHFGQHAMQGRKQLVSTSSSGISVIWIGMLSCRFGRKLY